MTPTDDELMAHLTDPANPRTPLHFKVLNHQAASPAPFRMRAGASAFHRSEGYPCGITAGLGKPISKLFGDDDDGGDDDGDDDGE